MSNIKKVLVGTLLAVFAFSASADATMTWSRSLKQGSVGADVKDLQIFLNMCADSKVAMAGAGSPGMETKTFGPATKAAVIKWQAARGVTPASGLFGPLSRAKAADLQASSNVCGGGTVVTPPVGQTGPVTASLAANNPASSTLVAGQATADLAHFTFTGSGSVTSVTLNRTGVSANATLSNVYLYDGGTRLTDAASVTSNGTVTFSNPAGLFMVNGSKTVSVRADIANTTSGQTVGVMLSNYSVMGQSSTNMVSLSGNLMSIASATDLATAVLGTTNTVVGNPTVDAGTSNYTVWGNTLQIAQRSVWLKGANFRVIGSAESGALQNARLIVDGAQVGSAISSVMANSNLGFDLSAAPLALTTGSHTVEVRVDVIGGANRSFYLSLQNAGDIMLTDSQYNVNLTLFSTAVNTVFSMNSGVSIAINSGTLSLAKDNTFNSTTTVTAGASNVTLAKYTLRSYGEAVKVMQVTVDVDLASGTEGLNNVGLYVNGAQVGTSQNSPAFTTYTGGADANTVLTYNLGSSLIIPAGQLMNLEVRADTTRTGGTNYTGAIVTTVVIPVGQAQGQTSYALYPVGTPLTSTPTTVTAGAATANVTKSSGFLTTTVGTSVSNARVGSYVLTAGTTEGLRVTNLAVSIDQTTVDATSGDVELTDIANLRATVTVAGGTPIQLNSVNPQATNNFSTDFTIPAGQAATIDIYVDVTNATASETIQTNLLATARGASSNVILSSGTGIASAQAGQELTVGSGTVSSTTIVSGQSTSQRYVIGGSTIDPIIRYNVKPTAGAITIEKLTFDIAGTANVITALTVTGTNGGSSCTVQVPSGATSVQLTGCQIPVPYNAGGTDIIVTPTINFVGIGGVSSGSTVTATVDLTTFDFNDGSTTASYAVTAAVSNAVRPVASLPTLTLTGAGTNLIAGEVKVGTVTISASTGGNIKLNTLPVTVNLSGGALLDGVITTNVLVLKEGNTVVTTTDNVTTDTATASGVITFSNTEIVTANSSRTFDIYLVIKSGTVTGDDAGQISLSASSSLSFDDVNGGGTAMPGTYILNYPTNTISFNDGI